MLKLSSNTLIGAVASALAAAAVPFIAYAGFGVSPAAIEEMRLVPGSHFEQTIYLVQGAPEATLGVVVSADAPDIKDWITFPGGTEFTIPAGVQQYPLKVVVRVPKDAPLGIYRAFVRVNTVPPKAEGAGTVAIALGGRVDLTLGVGNDVIEDYEIRRIQIENVPERRPLQAKVLVQNKGNVAVKPGAVSFELFNKFGNIRLGYVEATPTEDVESFSEKEMLLTFPLDVTLATGEYWGHVRVFDRQGNVKKELRTVFNVYQLSFMQKYATYLVAGAALLALIVLLAAFRRISRRSKKRA